MGYTKKKTSGRTKKRVNRRKRYTMRKSKGGRWEGYEYKDKHGNTKKGYKQVDAINYKNEHFNEEKNSSNELIPKTATLKKTNKPSRMNAGIDELLNQLKEMLPKSENADELLNEIEEKINALEDKCGNM